MLNVSDMVNNNPSIYNNAPTVTPTPEQPERTDNFSQVGSLVGTMAAGGASSFKFSAEFSSTLKGTIQDVKTTEGGFASKFKSSLPGAKSIAMTEVKAAGIGALVSGAVSAISNGVEVLQGKKTGADAVGTFAADTVNGAVGAMAGVTAGGLATFALGSMFTGTPLLIVGVAAGALGALAADRMFKGLGAYDGLRNTVMNGMSQK